MIRAWRNNWEDLTPFLEFPQIYGVSSTPPTPSRTSTPGSEEPCDTEDTSPTSKPP